MWSFFPYPFSSLEHCPPAVPQRHLQHFSSASNLPSHPLGCGRSRPLLLPHVLPIAAETSLVASLHLIKSSFLSKSHISPSLSPLPGGRAERFHEFPQALPTAPSTPSAPSNASMEQPQLLESSSGTSCTPGPLWAARASPRGETAPSSPLPSELANNGVTPLPSELSNSGVTPLPSGVTK